MTTSLHQPMTTTGKTLVQARTLVSAKVVKAGSTIMIPNSMTYEQAIDVLKRQIESDEKIVVFDRTIPVFPWEGARALRKAMEQKFGVFLTQDKMTMFGPVPPKEVTINTGVNTTETVPWGVFQWPMAEPTLSGEVRETLETGVGFHKGRMVFQVSCKLKRKWEGEVKALLDLAEKIAAADSLYRGQAVRIAFTDEDGEMVPIPTPEFLDLSGVKIDDIVYTAELTKLIETYIMTPLRFTKECRIAGIPRKRGVLAAGPYGTGKSLLAQYVGKVGVENGWTFLYIKNAAELPHAIRFAQAYQPCVIFAEDLDRAVEGETRTEAIDEILNTLDGIDSKESEIMVVFTTNDLSTVNPAMRRPGRLDVVINVTAPDAEAAAKLVAVYGRGLIAENADLRKVGELLDGATPAVIREVVERAKLAMISRTRTPSAPVLPEDLEVSAYAMSQQQKLLSIVKTDDKHWSKGMMEEIAHTTKGASAEAINEEVGDIALR